MGRTSTMRQLLRTISKEEAETFQTFYENQKENKIYTAMLTWNMFVLLLRIAGPVLFLLLQISTIITAREVANGSRANLSPLPNIFLFANCIVWSIYGVLKEDGTIFIPNFIGVLTSLYCMIIFHSYMAIKPYKMYFLALILCVGCLHLARLGEVSTIGLLGSTLAVLFMASPLTVVRTVIRDKSTQSLPFATSLVIWLNSLSWFLYGKLVADELIVWLPNALGLLLASVQLLLFAIYGFGSEKKNDVDNTSSSSKFDF